MAFNDENTARLQKIALEFTQNQILSERRWSGIRDLPRKIKGGYPYTGVNIPSLLGQLPDPRSQAVFGTYGQWREVGKQVRRGEKGLGMIFMKSFQKKKSSEDDLKGEGEDLDVTDNGQVTVVCSNYSSFALCQTDGYDGDAGRIILEAIHQDSMDESALIESGRNAMEAARRYMREWSQLKIGRRVMTEGEYNLIIHLAADLVVGFNAGSMQLAGELSPSFTSIALAGVQQLKEKEIMRPWGIACDILKQVSPVFHEQIRRGDEAAKKAQEDYKKKNLAQATATIEDAPKSTSEAIPISVIAPTATFGCDW